MTRYIKEELSFGIKSIISDLVKGISLDSHRCLSFASQFKFDFNNEASVFIEKEDPFISFFLFKHRND
jgi:hypothetical protein